MFKNILIILGMISLTIFNAPVKASGTPDIPTNVSASVSGSAITLTWLEPLEATYYKLQYRDGSGSWNTSGAKYYNGFHRWTGLSNIYNRSYRVAACKTRCSSWSSASNRVSITPPPAEPSPPTNVRASTSGTSITLRWNESSNATYYRLQYRDGASNWTSSSVKYYNGYKKWTGMNSVTDRSYRMKACNNSGCSSYSSGSNKVTIQPIPAPPTGLAATKVGSSITLKWTNKAYTDYVKLQYRDGGNTWKGSTVKYYGTSVTWNNLASITGRSYRLQACNNTGCSSSWSSATTLVETNQPPKANAGSDKHWLEWSDVSITGSGSDVDGSISSYQWSQISGPALQSWQDKNKAKTIFKTPKITKKTQIKLRLTVTDSKGATSYDDMLIYLNERPIVGKIDLPTIGHFYTDFEDIYVRASAISDASDRIEKVQVRVRSFINSSWKYSTDWKDMTLDASRTSASISLGNASSLSLAKNIKHQVIIRAIDYGTNGGSGWGWWKSQDFYINSAPVITNQRTLEIDQGSQITLALADITISDVDHSNHTLLVLSGSDYTRNGNTITPSKSFSGNLNVRVQVSDGVESSSIFNIAITVKPKTANSKNIIFIHTDLLGSPVAESEMN